MACETYAMITQEVFLLSQAIRTVPMLAFNTSSCRLSRDIHNSQEPTLIYGTSTTFLGINLWSGFRPCCSCRRSSCSATCCSPGSAHSCCCSCRGLDRTAFFHLRDVSIRIIRIVDVQDTSRCVGNCDLLSDPVRHQTCRVRSAAAPVRIARLQTGAVLHRQRLCLPVEAVVVIGQVEESAS